MKTRIIFKPLILLMCLGGFMTMQSQSLFDLSPEDEEVPTLKWNNYNDAYDALDSGVGWANSTIGGSAGVGWSDVEGSSEISYCLGAEYLYKITGADQNPKGAGYLGAFANYSNMSADNFDQSNFRFGGKYNYFDRITAFNEVQLIYGAKAFYETGSIDFSGNKDDLTGIGVNIFTGANFRLCDDASLGVEVPVVSFLSRTFESNGNEFKQDTFSAAVNKDNPIMATLRWNLGS